MANYGKGRAVRMDVIGQSWKFTFLYHRLIVGIFILSFFIIFPFSLFFSLFFYYSSFYDRLR